jgi:hypothetical protein
MARALTEIPEAEPRNITARVLAPLALAACVLALFLLVSGSLSGDDEDGGGGRDGQRTEKPRDRPELRSETYVVVPGDTLSGIATRADVTQARLEKLNPELDTATLNAGQEIRLRRR